METKSVLLLSKSALNTLFSCDSNKSHFFSDSRNNMRTYWESIFRYNASPSEKYPDGIFLLVHQLLNRDTQEKKILCSRLIYDFPKTLLPHT